MPNCCVCNHPNRTNAKFCAHCRAPLILQNKYRITRLLGRGGYGAVYQAEQLHLGNAPCAVKELLPDPKATPAQQQAASEQFRLEAGLLANLNHPALPKVTDFFTEGNSHFLVMEYVEGETLEERLTRNGGPLPKAQVLAWASELCDVLTYLHTRQPSPVIHRDVKPANIKITPDGKLKLIDFGISKVLAKGTGDAARAVSPPYSPLEQYGKGLRTDARSDIYALGVTLYELLTNRLPPEAPDRATEAVIPPRQFNPALSPHTETVILKAMAEKADERYQSAVELKQALTTPLVPPFVFRGGGQARDLQELVRLCESKPQDAIWHLMNGHFEPWLTALGRADLARAATFARQSTVGGRGLEQFLDATGLPHTYTYKPPSPPPPPPPQPQRGWAWLAVAVAAIVLCAMGATIFGFQQIQQQQSAQAMATTEARATMQVKVTAQAQATATAQVQATITEQALATVRAEVYAVATGRAKTATTTVTTAQVQATPTLTAALILSTKSPFKDLTFGRGGIVSKTNCRVKELVTTVTQEMLIDDPYFYFAMPFHTSDIGKKIYWSVLGPDPKATREKIERELETDDDQCFWQGFAMDPMTTPGTYWLEITFDREVVYRTALKIEYANITSRRPIRESFGRFTFGRGGLSRRTCLVATVTDRINQNDMKDDPWLYFASPYAISDIGQTYYWTVYKPDGSIAFNRIERTLQDEFWLCAVQGFSLGETPSKGKYRLVIEYRSRLVFDKMFTIE
jgi:serine/threonine protein kinase